MKLFKHGDNREYFLVPREVESDLRHNLAALGLWMHLWSKPEGWTICYRGIVTQTGIGSYSTVKKLFKALELAGYLWPETVHVEGKTIKSWNVTNDRRMCPVTRKQQFNGLSDITESVASSRINNLDSDITESVITDSVASGGDITESVITDSVDKKRRSKKSKEKIMVANAPHQAELTWFNPDDFQEIPQSWEAYCRERRPDLNPHDTFESFRSYWTDESAKKNKKALKSNWKRAWQDWVRKQYERKHAFASTKTGPTTV